MVEPHPDIRARAAALSLEQKITLLTGQDFWTTHPVDEIGLRSLVLSDGPSGVRGESWDERDPSLNLPSASALSSAWSEDIAERYGAASAAEAQRKGVDVVLGPTINLHRSPRGGRHFEAFSEDPRLSGILAAAYIRGVQAAGVAATPKHYVANDSETERFTVDVAVDERTLHELYLLPFEIAVREGRAWAIMSAYNSINGATATENTLLDNPLRTDWGFDGVVVSDWTAVRSTASAAVGQDLEMPGPQGAWGPALLAAVQAGEVSEDAITAKVENILLLAERVGGFAAPRERDGSGISEDSRSFARDAEIAGTVLVQNSGVLPLAATDTTRIAVIGHNATQARTQGGGSATVIPDRIVTPLDGIRAAFPDAELSYSIGAIVQEGLAELPLETITNPVTGEPGARVAFLDADGSELHTEDRRSTALVWFGGSAPVAASSLLRVSFRYTPAEDSAVGLGWAAVGQGRLYINDELRHEADVAAVGDDLGAALLAPPSSSIELDLSAGVPLDVRVEYELGDRTGALAAALGITVGTEPASADPAELIAAAARAAADADVAVVVVGTNSRVESEGYDRDSLALPGRQDDLVRAVIAANPRTVVVVNAGAPVELPWRDDAAAILLSWFGGQEYGNALGAILSGAAEPGGRLPTTWPGTLADTPVSEVVPSNGVLSYTEGIHIGYRAWLRAGATPAWPFGHGLGYTSWQVGELSARVDGDWIVLDTTATNTGDRDGRTVVQFYASRAESAIDRPVRWLVGWAEATAAAGESVALSTRVALNTLAHWQDGWQLESGDVTITAASSVTDLHGSATITI
ncbi:MAG: beta-glucosidase [Mycetocola sp.]